MPKWTAEWFTWDNKWRNPAHNVTAGPYPTWRHGDCTSHGHYHPAVGWCDQPDCHYYRTPLCPRCLFEHYRHTLPGHTYLRDPERYYGSDGHLYETGEHQPHTIVYFAV